MRVASGHNEWFWVSEIRFVIFVLNGQICNLGFQTCEQFGQVQVTNLWIWNWNSEQIWVWNWTGLNFLMNLALELTGLKTSIVFLK